MFRRLRHLQEEFNRKLKTSFEPTIKYVYRVSQEFRSLFRDLIPELMMNQRRHIHMGPIHNSSKFMSFYNTGWFKYDRD